MVLVVIRPFAVLIATTGTELTLKERLFVAWIAPRGIVAVAVTGVFSASLTANGVADGETMTALAFAIVVTTILLHGFSLGPLASMMGLKTSDHPGVLIVGVPLECRACAKTQKARCARDDCRPRMEPYSRRASCGYSNILWGGLVGRSAPSDRL